MRTWASTWVSNSAAQPRMNTVPFFIFAPIGLVVASMGIYGVLAYSVSQRTGENGLCMALGVSRGDIFRLGATEGVLLAVTGLVVGSSPPLQREKRCPV